MKKLTTLIFYFIFLTSCSPAQKETAEEPLIEATRSFASQINTEQQKQTLLKENKRCIRCHQIARKIEDIPAIKMLGQHASVDFYDNCTACHGIKASHPKQNGVIIDLSQHSNTPLEKQNGQCLQCHNPLQLRQAEWTHDVHYKNINCSSCHQLHQTIDPIKDIPTKQRIQLCVDCHRQIRR